MITLNELMEKENLSNHIDLGNYINNKYKTRIASASIINVLKRNAFFMSDDNHFKFVMQQPEKLKCLMCKAYKKKELFTLSQMSPHIIKHNMTCIDCAVKHNLTCAKLTTRTIAEYALSEDSPINAKNQFRKIEWKKEVNNHAVRGASDKIKKQRIKIRAKEYKEVSRKTQRTQFDTLCSRFGFSFNEKDSKHLSDDLIF